MSGHERSPRQAQPRHDVRHDVRPEVRHQPVPLGPHQAILGLQRSSGNAAVRDLLSRPAHPDTARPDSARPDTADQQVQRFGGKEHRNIGDWATNRKYVTLGSKGYRLSYGEMIALAGDLFPSLAYMEKLANRRGPGPETQEALDYARFIKIGRRDSADARTRSQQVQDDASGGFPDDERRYDPANYSKATVKAVDAMYYKLASDNASHFVSPLGKDAAKKPWERPHSAGANYRENHEEALRRACRAGKRGESATPALAAESFGGHFLTDAISAGHVRTPRLDIVAHWDKLDTGLVTRFKGFMMTQVSEWILDNRQRYNLLGPGMIYSSVADGIDKALAGRPALTLGILVALAVQDYDNKHGLKVLSGGKKAKVFGDHHLKEGDTEKIAIAAVRAGYEDVRRAYRMGKEGKSFAQITTALSKGGQYKAESLLPRLDPAAGAQKMPRWAVGSFSDLLQDPVMREALALTILNNLAEIEEVAASLSEPGRSGILKGFVPLVKKDPISALRNIYSFVQTPIFDLRNLPAVGVSLPTH